MTKSTKGNKKIGLAARLAQQGESKLIAPHIIVEALAGTGKTTTLIEALQILLTGSSQLTPSPQQQAVWEAIASSKGVRRIGFMAFNRSIAEELKERVPPGVEAMTMHSLGNRTVWERFGKLYVTEYRTEDLISFHTGIDFKELRSKDAVMLKAVKDLVRLCKMNLIDGKDTDELARVASHYDVELDTVQDRVFELVPEILELSLDVLRDRKMDYSDMIWLPIALNLPIPQYDLLLIDESQDLNRCQQALACKAGKRLVFCGDKRQAIYGFAGADSESMDRLAQELADTERGVQILPLTVTRRCGKAIVEEAKKLVPTFEAHESNSEGSVKQIPYESKKPTGANSPTYHDVVEDGDMILCRVNAPLVSQCFQFLRMGRKAEIQGRDIGGSLIKMVKKFKVTMVVDLVGKLSEWLDQEQQKEQKAKFPNENKLIALQDKYDCLLMFCEDVTTVDEVIERIKSVFTDNKHSPGIKLSSIHKAKGLEANRVFLLEPKGATVPHPMAKSDWQKGQEWNLRYVAITRAINELVYVTE